MKRYQVVLNSAAGIHPQKDEIYKTREEAQAAADKRNRESGNLWATYEVVEHEYEEVRNDKKRRKI